MKPKVAPMPWKLEALDEDGVWQTVAMYDRADVAEREFRDAVFSTARGPMRLTFDGREES